MSEFSLAAQERSITGKEVKNIRLQGLVPGVVYGKGTDPVHVQVVDRDFRTILRAGARDQVINLDLNGTAHKVTIQELQRHLTRGDLIHVDFMLA